MTKKTAVEALLDQSMQALEAAMAGELDTLAKADRGNLDEDFKEFDQARQASDNANEAAGEDGMGGPDEDDQDGTPDDGEDDETPDDEDTTPESGAPDDEDTQEGAGGQKPGARPVFGKADQGGEGFVDAAPVLEALDGRLDRLEGLLTRVVEDNAQLRQQNGALTQQNAVLAKAMQAVGRGTAQLMRVATGNLEQPALPKSKRVVVPTQTAPTTVSRDAVLAKAEQFHRDGKLGLHDVSHIEYLVQGPGGVDEAYRNYPQLADAQGGQ